MGEIKSTLDLVMEKTRGLVPSPEEREAMARKEHRERVAALARRIREGGLSTDRLEPELRDLEKTAPAFPWRQELCRACGNGVSLGEDANALLAALDRLGCAGADDVRAARDEALAGLKAMRASVEERMAEELRAAGISGSAVVPNVAGDPGWQEKQESLAAEFARRRDELLGPERETS